jgi:hypothetical protein
MKQSLKKDALSLGCGFYRMNARYAIGYLFNPNESGKEVANGMFCNNESEINGDEWTFFYRFSDNKFITIK